MGFLNLSKIPDVIEHKVAKQYNCSHCKLYTKCEANRLKPTGIGRLGILIVGGEVSLAQENSNNSRQGSHYLYLKRRLKEIGISIEDDCYYVNAIRCYTTNDKHGVKTTTACASLLQNDIKLLKPKVIMVTDELGWNILMANRMSGTRAKGSLWDYQGSIIPDQELKTWVAPMIATHFLIEAENEIARKKKEYGEHYKGANRFEPHYKNHLDQIIETINKPLPTFEWLSKVRVASNVHEAISFLNKANEFSKFAFDYETTGLAWHRAEQKVHSVSFSDGEISYAMMWYPDNKEFMDTVAKLLTNDSVKIAFNMAFERSWSIGRAGVEPTKLIHDPMLMAHVWRNLASTNLKFCLYREFGILGYDEDAEEYLKPAKDEESKYGKNAMNNIFKAPTDKILLYVGLDSLFTYWLAKYYLERMDKVNMMPGYKLLARAERPLTWMHLHGIHVDLEAMAYWEPIIEERINTQYKIIMDSAFIQEKWQGANKFKPGSDADLRELIFNILKLKPTSFTDKGLPSVDADALEDMRDLLPIAEPLLEYRRWYKLLNTFMAGIKREQWDGKVHMYFNLNNIDSFRSSSNRINMQNIPKRDAEIMDIIRSLFIPSKGHKLTSCDYSALEIKANAGITRDKNLLASVTGGLDSHYEMAKKLFMLSDEQKNKSVRNVSKQNNFRLFYGGSGSQMAEGTWKIIHSSTALAQLGMDMKAHIKSKGIETYEQWESHCINVEKWLWGELFPDYQKWRKETYANYLQTGKFYYPNGFTYQGVCSRNSLLNAGGQGAGFHINLEAICNIFDELQERKMKTKLVITIHDDDVGDVAPEEEEEWKKILYKHMVEKAHDYSPWMKGVPLEVEYGCTEVDRPWNETKTVGILHY